MIKGLISSMDNAFSFEILNVLDANSRHNQIRMYHLDKDKIMWKRSTIVEQTLGTTFN